MSLEEEEKGEKRKNERSRLKSLVQAITQSGDGRKPDTEFPSKAPSPCPSAMRKWGVEVTEILFIDVANGPRGIEIYRFVYFTHQPGHSA